MRVGDFATWAVPFARRIPVIKSRTGDEPVGDSLPAIWCAVEIEAWREAGIPLARLHDCEWPAGNVVDFHAVFPRLEADPDWPYPHGLHHLVVDGNRIYIDAKRTRYDLLRWLKVWLYRVTA